MSNTKEYPESENRASSVEKIKWNEGLTKKDLTNLQNAVVYGNREAAEKHLKALKESIGTPKDKKEIVLNMSSDELDKVKQNRVSITPHVATDYTNTDQGMDIGVSIQNEITPLGFKGAFLGSTESAKIVVGSTKKLLTDLVLLPYDIYNHFKKDSKKIG